VNSNKTKVLGIGYNGAPQLIDDDIDMPWPDVDGDYQNKNDFVIHAEANALALSDFAQHQNSVMYCTHYPCKECVKTMLHYGVRTFYYLDDSKTTKAQGEATYEPARRLLDVVKAKRVIVEKLQMDMGCIECFTSKLSGSTPSAGVASDINAEK
jgi:dCMP deaminase